MSSHPGSTMKDAIALACYLKKEGIHPEQVQDFYPTPGTISTCMFWTGLDPYTMEPVHVTRSPKEKAEQRALLQYYKPENHARIREALIRAGRRDLIGSGPDCLVPAEPHAAHRPAAGKGGRPNDTRNVRPSDRRGGRPSPKNTKKSPKDGRSGRKKH